MSGPSKAAQHTANMKYIMDNVFNELDHVPELLASVGLKTLADLVGCTKLRLERATFKDPSDGSAKTIEETTFNHLWAFKKYVASRDRLCDPDLRFLGDFTKVDPLDFLDFYNSIIADANRDHAIKHPKQQADFRHIIDDVLQGVDGAEECLASINITTVNALVLVQKSP